MRARDDDLRALGRAAHLQHVELEAVVEAVWLGFHLLLRRQNGLYLAEVDEDVLELATLDRSGHYLADALVVFLVYFLALRLADALHKYLLGGLSIDAAHGAGSDFDLQHLAGHNVGIVRSRLFDADLAGLQLGVLGDGLQAEHLERCLGGVYPDLYLALRREVLLIRGHQSRFHGL